MNKFIFVISVVVIMFACNNIQSTRALNDTTTIKMGTPIINPPVNVDTSNVTNRKQYPDDILKLIANFSEAEFRDSRKELVKQGAEYNYKISEIKKLGNVLKYDVVIPGIEGKMEYTCNPKRGDFTIIMVGDKEVAQMQYNQNKVGLKWDNCNTSENGEQCDTYIDMDLYPLKTHFSVSIVNYQTGATFIFHRVIMPK